MSLTGRVFFDAAPARTLTAARIITSAHALWLLLSRPCLPELFTWPMEFWSAVLPATRLRYGWGHPSLEWPLWVAALIAVTAAPMSRAASFAASLLVYHFAPLEDAFIASPGPYARGLTVSVLAFAVFAFCDSSNARWPLTLARFAVASQYTFSTIAKLRVAGLEWFSPRNIEALARTFDMLGVAPHPELVDGHYFVAAFIGAAWLTISIAAIAAPFSRRVAIVVVPMLAVAHVAAAVIFGVVWLAAPLLLLFVEWGQSATPNSSHQRASG